MVGAAWIYPEKVSAQAFYRSKRLLHWHLKSYFVASSNRFSSCSWTSCNITAFLPTSIQTLNGNNENANLTVAQLRLLSIRHELVSIKMCQTGVKTPGPEKPCKKLSLYCFSLFLVKIIWRFESEKDLLIHWGTGESHHTVMDRQIFLLIQIKGNLLEKKAMICMKDVA